MKHKKTASANLENKRFIFLQIGVIVSLAFALTAFELKSYEVMDVVVNHDGGLIIEEDFPPITIIPKKPKPKIVITDITIIIDKPEIEPDNIEFSAETTPDDEIPIWTPPEIEDEPIDEADLPFISVQEMPGFPGGVSALLNFLSENINYPDMAIESNIMGVVYLQFIVERDGSITDIIVVRGIGGGCDEEAVRVARMMPKWKAGRQMSKAVRVKFTLPVRFVLQ